MKGITFNLLEEIVQREHGEEAWDQLIESAQLDGVYTSLVLQRNFLFPLS